MKWIKRLLLAVLFLLVLLIGFAFAAPIIFKNKIVENVKKSINSTVNASVDFRDVNVSFLRSFPAINLQVDDYSVLGIDTFAGYPLVRGKSLALDLDFWSVWSGSESGEYEILSIRLVEPDIQLLILNEALANYHITKSSEEDTLSEEASAAMLFSLRSFEIENGRFLYDDRLAETYMELVGLNTKGTGDFTLDVFDLETLSDFEAFTLRQSGIAYLSKANGALDAVINIDMPNSRYTFKENTLRLNALELSADGSIAMPGDAIVFDLNVSAPSTDFRQLWSMIPAAYTTGYEQVKTKGTFDLKASIKGPYQSDKPTYPSFNVAVNVQGGSVQYPGKTVAIEAIQAALSVVSPGSNLDQLVVNIPQFNLNLGGDPFSGRFALSRPISDPTVDARIKGKLDLQKWAQAMPLEAVEQLSGLILADVTLENVRQSVVEAGNYAAIKMEGKATISDLVYATKAYPRIALRQAQINFSPQSVDANDFILQLGQSDLSGSVKIRNLLAYFSPEKTLQGSVWLRSNYFNADEWVSEEESSTPLTPAELAASEPSNEEVLFNRFAFDIQAQVEDLQYSTYRLKNSRLSGQFTPNYFQLQDAATTLGSTSLTATGTVKNAWDYYFGDAILGGQLAVRSAFIDTGDFMEEESSSTAAATEEALAVIPVPNNINLRVSLAADQVKYTDILLNQFTGDLVVANEQVVIENGQTSLLGGRMQFAGAYDTSEPGEPSFRFHYDLKELGFNQAFTYLNSFKALVPVAEFLQGKFNSDLIVEGKLGQDLYPVLSSIDAKGFLQTRSASFTNRFKPLEKIGNALDVPALKERIDLKEIKSWFTIEKGQVTIAPFELNIAGIPMQINGTHGLDMDMSYQIQAAVPRSMMQSNIVTGSAMKALDQLAGQANRLGLTISPTDTLQVKIALGGRLQDPSTSFELQGLNQNSLNNTKDALLAAAAEQAKAEAAKRVEEQTGVSAEKVEQTKQEIKQGIDSAKQVVNYQVQKAKDTIRSTVNQTVDAAKQEAENRIKDAIGIGRDSSSNVTNPTEGVKDAVNDIKNDLEKFNPFKKKKKDGN